MDKRFWTILAIIAVFVVGAIWISNKNASAPNHGQPTQHVEGQGKDHVTLVEYGDYECPICDEYYQPVKQLVAAYSPYITFQFRNFPLTSLHKNAFAGAQAAEAANLQGKFWQMHDLLYANQNSWAPGSNPEPYFLQYARQLGLNVNKFKQDLTSTKVTNSIDADMAAGNKLNIQGTPTFFLDGEELNNGQLINQETYQPEVQKFADLLNAAIVKKTGKPAPSINLNLTSTTTPATTNSSKQLQSKQ